METLKNVKLQLQDGKTAPIRIEKRNNALAYIRKLLENGFRGDIYYYRDNDRRLILKVWENEGLVLNKEQKRKFLLDVTMPTSIARRRRELRHRYPESEYVMQKRYNLFIEKKERYSGVGRIRRFINSKV